MSSYKNRLKFWIGEKKISTIVYLPVLRWKKTINATMSNTIAPKMNQKEVVLVMKGKSTFIPNMPVTTVRGSMMVLK